MPLLLSGCLPQSKPSGPPTAISSSHAKGPRPGASEKPVATPARKVLSQQPPRLRDDFNLPLVIEMEAPEAPPEIAKRSPPIHEPKKSP
jgi:hypothetical protein